MPLFFPISNTKITIPTRRPEVVTRPRLVETLLDQLDKLVVMVVAPAGYGKTTLLVDLAARSEIPICWLSLDVLDTELQRFLTYFIACIHERYPDFGKESSIALNNMVSFEQDSERLIVTLTNEIQNHIHEHFAIILDDYQFINGVPGIRIFVNRFLQLANENCHLILSSRVLPNLPDLHVLVMRNQVSGIGVEELAFQPQEVQDFYAHNGMRELTLEEAGKLVSETEGWITSLYLTVQQGGKGGAKVGPPVARTGIDLFEYFSREILDKQLPDVREFLLLTSPFDEISPDLCKAVLDPIFPGEHKNWKSLFKQVQQANLFNVPFGPDGQWIRYHHLFQDFLQSKLQEEYPELCSKVMQQLASVYLQRKEWEKAHFIYENLNDEKGLVTVIEQAGSAMIRYGRVVTLGRWLEKLPVGLTLNNPCLLSLQGVVLNTQGDTQYCITLFNQAESLFRQQNDISQLALLLVRRGNYFRQAGNYVNAIADAEEVLFLTRESFEENIIDTYISGLRIKGLALFRLGKTLEAIEYHQKALVQMNRVKEKSNIPILEMEIGMMEYTLGHYETAIRYYHRAEKVWEENGNLGWLATLKNNLGVLYHICGDYRQAFTTLEAALDCGKRSGYVRTQALALSSLGDVLADVQDYSQAWDCLEQAGVMASHLGDSFLIFYGTIAKARIARLKGDLQQAQTILNELKGDMDRNPSQAEEAQFRKEYGCLLLSQDHKVEAVEELTRVTTLYESEEQALEVSLARLWLAAAFLANGMRDAGIDQIHQVNGQLKIFKESGQVYLHVAQVARWFDSVRNQDAVTQKLLSASTHYMEKLPEVRRGLREVSRLVAVSPPSLDIHGFGPAQVYLNGNLVAISDWQTRETRDLFYYFLQSTSATKEEIGMIFWPDISPARLKMRFKTNLYRLRHAVGQDTILFDGERYRFNREGEYRYDVFHFEDLIKKEQVNNGQTPDQTIAYLQAAVDLVTGAYLADLDADWVYAQRSHYEELYLSTLMKLGHLYLKAGKAERTIETCNRAITADPLHEEAYRLNMQAFAALGDIAAIARQYQECLDVFQDELGADPSRETSQLYRKLTR